MGERKRSALQLRYWEWYQGRVAALFRRLRGATVDEDVSEIGHDSRTKRRLDVRVLLPLSIELAEAFSIEVPLKIIVDAKAHARPLDLPEVERVVGLKEDVRAHLGIVVTPKGISPGAAERAKAKGVYPVVVTSDVVQLIGNLKLPEFTPCDMCEYRPDDDYSAPEVFWDSDVEGHCKWCNTLHVRCPDCFEVFPIPDMQYDVGVRCVTECGAIFRVEFRGDYKEREATLRVFDRLTAALLLGAYRKSFRRLTPREVSRLVAKTRWQHWDVASPTINLTEEGLMEWGEDECLYLTPDGKDTVEDTLLDPEYAWWEWRHILKINPVEPIDG